MAATMRERDGKYIVTVHQDGKRTQKTYSVKRRAERAMNRANSALEAGGKVKPDQPKKRDTLNHFIDVWFELVVCNEEEPLAVGTNQRYSGIYKNKIENDIGKLHVDAVSRIMLMEYFRDLQLKKHTRSDISGRLCVINGGLSMAEEVGRGPGVPERIMKSLYRGKKKQEKAIQTFSASEVDTILSEAKKGKEYTLLLLLVHSGVRLGEALGLSWDCINFHDNYIVIKRSYRGNLLSEKTKNGIIREIPISKELRTLLANLKAERNENRLKRLDGDAVFTRNGKRLCQNSFRYTWSRLLEKCGIDHRKVHTLRHTVATRLMSNGEPVKLIAELLGHTVQTLLSTYTHEDEDANHKKRAMMRDLFAVESEASKHDSNAADRGEAKLLQVNG